MNLAKPSNPKVMDRRLQRWALPLLVVLAALAVAIVLRFMNRESEIKTSEDIYQYTVGGRQDYAAGATLLQGKYSITIRTGEGESDGDATPVYTQTSKALYLARDSAWTEPATKLEWLIPGSARLELNEQGVTRYVSGSKSVDMQGGILSDGAGTFIFLDYGTVELNHKTIQVTPFSFCSTYRSAVRIYDYAGEVLHTEDFLLTNIIFRAAPGYRIDLTTGIFTDSRGKHHLMVASPRLSESIEKH